MTERQYAAALAYANDLRAEMGMEPLDALPKGRVREGGSECPLGRACPGWFFLGDGTRYPIGDNGEPTDDLADEVELPDAVREFIELFDDKAYPELIA